MTTIDVKIRRLYAAAHDHLPGQAEEFSGIGSDISTSTETIVAQLRSTTHPIAGPIGTLGEELVVRLRTVTKTLNESAVALDKVADDFVATDDDAAAWFAQHRKELKDADYTGTPESARPPALPEL